MKILFTIGDLNSGGAEKVIATLANNFSNSGHDVSILMLSTDEQKSFYSINTKVKIVPLLKKNESYNFRKKLNLIREYIELNCPDVIISFLNYVIIYTYFALRKCSNRKNIKFIVSERNNPKKVPSSFPFRLLRNHIFRKADACVFQTEGAQNYFKRVKSKYIIPNPVFLYSPADRSKVNENILLVGSDKKEKNRSLAFKAFAMYKAKNKDSNLVVVGEKSCSKELKLLNKLSISDSVIFVGKMINWHEKYRNCRVFLLSSNFEGMPNALLEACSLQIPCISTDCPSGGPKDILENGKRGILVPIKNTKIMGQELINLGGDVTLLEHYAKINSDMLELYNEKTISEKWLHFIGQIKS